MSRLNNDNRKLSDHHHHSNALYPFFHHNLEQVFADLRLSNKDALDYITSILTQFARTENLFRIKQLPKFKLDSVVETILQVEANRHSDESFSENEEIFIRKHIGDFTLFMSGIFREYVQRMGFLEYYHLEGRRSYQRVFDYAFKLYEKKAPVFEDLSHKYETYSSALDYLKKVYFYFPDMDEPIRKMLNRLLSW